MKIRSPRTIYLWSIIVGVAVGLGSLAFCYALAYVEYGLLEVLAGLELAHPPGEFSFPQPGTPYNAFIACFLPAIGGFLASFVIQRFCPDARGNGTDQTIHAFHHEEGRMSPRVPLFKAIATILTLGTGGSAGKEGPTAQIGAGIGAAAADVLNAGARARRTLLLAGTAAGLGAVFRAPLGGALTAVEMIYHEDIESDSLIPCIISSVTAYLTYTLVAGSGSVFKMLNIGFEYRELPFYLFLGLLCHFMGFLFIQFFSRFPAIFSKIPVPFLRPAAGGLLVGLVGLAFPMVLGSGTGTLQEALAGRGISTTLPLWFFFLLLAFLKIAATTFSIGSGGSGGLFAPSLFIGAMLGGFVAEAAGLIFGSPVNVSSFMLVGMGAFYAGVARAPIAGMVMICEMIGSYELLPPLMVVTIVGFLFSRTVSVYKGQIKNRFESPAHYWDMNLDLLSRMTVADIPEIRKFAVVERGMLLGHLEERAINVQASDFVVLNPDGDYGGIVSLRKVRLTRDSGFLSKLVTVGDAADTSIPAVQPSSTLSETLALLLEKEVDKIAVAENGLLLGYVRYTDIMNAYQKRAKKRD